MDHQSYSREGSRFLGVYVQHKKSGKNDPNSPILPIIFLEMIMSPAMLKFFGGGFIFLMFTPYLGKIPILTSIFFQMGWFNHQAGCLCSALIWWKNDPNLYSPVEASKGFFWCVQDVPGNFEFSE